jgi:uncharacterized coiled-coil protein SlyX
MKIRFKIFTTILSALACFGLFSRAQAADDEVFPGGNTAAGFHSLNGGNNGSFNTAYGWFSQGFNGVTATGFFNTAIGAGSLDLNFGNLNTAAGTAALLLNLAAENNTAVGTNALLNNDFTTTAPATANDNTAVGFEALLSNLDAGDNTAVGSHALEDNDSTGSGAATGNTAVGSGALESNVDGSGNTAVGRSALLAFDGDQSTAVGNLAGLLNFADETTAVGAGALSIGINGGIIVGNTGVHNTAVGFHALFINSLGDDNTAMGHSALLNNTTGEDNTAVGWQALRDEDTGPNQTAVGSNALLNSQGSFGSFDNSAFGRGALEDLVGGARNTALGDLAGTNIVGGSSNTIVGADSGGSLVAGSSNTYIGADTNGAGDESGFIRIRNSNAQQAPVVATSSKVFIDAIWGASIPNISVRTVRVNSRGQLAGIVLSSERYKKDIKPMDKASESILALKPVTFHYKEDPTNTLSYGLVAEDVAKVAPDLAIMDKEGKPMSVLYEEIPVRLLNEFLKEHKKVEEQQAAITELKSRVAQQQKGMEVLTAQLKEQAAQIQRVSAQLEVSKPAPQVVVNKP